MHILRAHDHITNAFIGHPNMVCNVDTGEAHDGKYTAQNIIKYHFQGVDYFDKSYSTGMLTNRLPMI